MRFDKLTWIGALLLAVSTVQPLQAQEHMDHAASATSKFINIPGLPMCVKGAVKNGDPSKGAFVILGKMTTGCLIPWHWHTAKEELMMVAGRAKVEMKEGSPAMLHPADYLNLPAKHVHQFTCETACTVFIGSDGAFDIHYVDAKGNEIAQDEALKTATRGARSKR
jgi:quercetin dioxygenase-like cupin family protein